MDLVWSFARERFWKIAFWCSVMGQILPVSSATAALDNQFEPEYSEAVLEFNAKNYSSALQMLSELQKKAPQSEEVLELKAITLKALKNEKEAANVYRDLVQLKTKEGRDKKEIAPYAFELGVFRYNEKNWKQAEQYLNYSIRYGFNVEVSRFYLGLIAIQAQEWAKAETHLQATLSSELEDLKPAAHLYLSQVGFKMGFPGDGFGHLLDAKRSARKFIDRTDVSEDSKKMSKQVYDAAEKTLAPLDKAQTFGNFSLMLGYDSNVLLLPSDSAIGASGTSTPKAMVSAGYGYASSPLSRIQYVPSIRFNFNKNSEEAASTGEFADTTASLFLTKDPLASISYGLKTEGTVVFQNQTDTSGSKSYRLFDYAFTAAPYFKWDASRKWTYGAEIGYRSTQFNGEDTLQVSQRRSGNAFYGRLTAQNKANRKYFNPTYALRVESNATEGTEFDSRILGLQIVNTIRFKKVDFSQVLAVDRTQYGNSSTNRGDTLLVLSLLASRKIGPRWALLASADYSTNDSSDASFSYNRYTLNAGVGYSF